MIVVLALFLAPLTVFPERYRAAVTLTPTDPGSLGFASPLTQLSAVQSALGQQTAVEVSLLIGRSDSVRRAVVERVKLDKQLGKTNLEAIRWLKREVDVRVLRGGIVQVDLKNRDANLAREIVTAYAVAIRSELARVSREQAAYKRVLLERLMFDASVRLTEAQTRYDTFRRRTRYSSPENSINAIGARVPELENQIIRKQTELNAAREFFTDDNLAVKQIKAEIDALNIQLVEARSLSPADPKSVGRVVRESTEVYRLKRELDLSRVLYESYERALEASAVEEFTSTANIRILEKAYIDTSRQYNLLFGVLTALILIAGLGIELYYWRLPVGEGQDRNLPKGNK